MKSLIVKYPRDWLEAKLLIRNLEREIKNTLENFPKGHLRSKQLIKIIRASYAILDSLNIAIANSKDTKEIGRLVAARKVLFNWMRYRKFIGDINER